MLQRWLNGHLMGMFHFYTDCWLFELSVLYKDIKKSKSVCVCLSVCPYVFQEKTIYIVG
jgi:hypothetical protein